MEHAERRWLAEHVGKRAKAVIRLTASNAQAGLTESYAAQGNNVR